METQVQAQISCPVCRAAAARLYAKSGFDIAECTSCKTLFVEDAPADTSDMYDQSYFFGGEAIGGGYGSYDEEKEAMRATFEKCLDRIATYKSHGALLDVGAATGYFLALARSRGFVVSGIDISAAVAHEAEKKGITIDVGTLEAVAYPSHAFDVVTLFDVLEHVAHPDTLMQSVARVLKPGGIVMGCTPDCLSLNARLMGKHWHLLIPPEHLILLNEKSLQLLLREQGFDVLWIGRITKRFSLPYILQTASRWLGVPLLSRIGHMLRGTWLSRIAIPLDLRDNLFFLARRR